MHVCVFTCVCVSPVCVFTSPLPPLCPPPPASGVEAEAELLAALTTFFSRVGLTPEDVGLKVSSRKVLAAVLERFEVPEENFAQVGSRRTCVCVCPHTSLAG